MDFRMRRAAGARTFDPYSLFRNGYTGTILNIQNFSTLFQDTLRATPVTAVGQSVKRVENGLDVDQVAYLDGSSGCYASTPDAAALDITGDIDIRVLVSVASFSSSERKVFAKAAPGQISWICYIGSSTDKLSFLWSPDGSATLFAISTAAPPVSGGELYLRYTLDVDNGAGGNTVVFYTSDDNGVSWDQLGDPVTAVGTTSIFNSSAVVQISSWNGASGDQHLAGAVYNAEIYNGIAGTKVFDLTPENYVSGSTYVCGTGQTVTLHGTALILKPGTAIEATNPPVLGVRPKVGKRNRCDYSEQLGSLSPDNVSVTANAAIAPDGTTTADKVIPSAANDTHSVYFQPSTSRFTQGQLVTASFYAKAAEYTHVRCIAEQPGGQGGYWFDLNNGTIGSDSSSGGDQATVVAMTSVGSGWYRCSVTYSRAASTPRAIYLSCGNTGENGIFVGDGVSGVYFWGAQWEAAAAVTAYQKTTVWYDTTQSDSPNVYFLAADGVNDKLTIPMSSVDLKCLHDGTGGYTAGVWQAGNVPNPNSYNPLLANNDGTGSVVGTLLSFDDRAGVPRNNAAVYLTTNGTVDNLTATANDSMTAATPTIVTVAFSTADSPDCTVITSVSTFGANTTGTPSSANAGRDLQVFGDGAGNYGLGTLDYLLIINRTLSVSEQSSMVSYLEGISGV